MTQDEFHAIRKEMATKEDLKCFATKDDLKQFATKDDLKYFATKDDLRQFATKDDFTSFKVEILQAFDKVLIRFDTAEKDNMADKLLHDRHEKRITRIETKLGIEVE